MEVEVEEKDMEEVKRKKEKDKGDDRGDCRALGTCLLAVVCDGRQDGAQRLHAHGNVQQVAGEKEVVVVAQQGHDRVPAEIQEGL